MIKLILILAMSTALSLCGSGAGKTKNDRFREVDLIELNHKYNEAGEHSFDQIIFWQWNPHLRRYYSVGWTIVKESHGLCGYPVKQGEWYRCRVSHWGGEPRVVHSKKYRETVTTYDPDLESAKLDGRPLRSILE